VQTGTYSAQYGAYLGVHLNMVTKSGTNALHGNVVEFIRNDAFDARGFFLPPTSRKTVLRQNQYGFELDGPVALPKIYNGRQDVLHGIVGTPAEQEADAFGQQHGDHGADVRRQFHAGRGSRCPRSAEQ